MRVNKAGCAGTAALVAFIVLSVTATGLAQDDARWKAALDEAARARQSGRVEDVEKILRSGLEEAEKFGPSDQPSAGKFDQAEPLYRRALGLIEKLSGTEHPNLIPILTSYAEVLRKTGRLDEAAKMEARAQALQGKPALLDVPTTPPPTDEHPGGRCAHV